MENNIKHYLDGRTIQWLADKLEMNRNTIAGYIKGTPPTLDVAYRIAKLLNAKVTEVWPEE